MKDYIKQLEQQNEELQQMLAAAQTQLVDAHKKLSMRNVPKPPPNKMAMETGLSVAERISFIKERTRNDAQIILGILLVATIICCITWGILATVDNARESAEQQANIKKWEQRIINARAAKVEQ